MLNRLFSPHALLLTFVSGFASENYLKAGGYSSEFRPISVRILSDFYPKYYGR